MWQVSKAIVVLHFYLWLFTINYALVFLKFPVPNADADRKA